MAGRSSTRRPPDGSQHTAEDYAAVVNVNLAGFFHITQLAIAEMERHSSGHVVSVTSSTVHHRRNPARRRRPERRSLKFLGHRKPVPFSIPTAITAFESSWNHALHASIFFVRNPCPMRNTMLFPFWSPP
ncbi:SDR family NAD(P)-dependent oxidoreductase [Paraburkholderia aspalathi]|nr:SDR family NAD(P)-dependent oxidoreductase [Paraburkholderia aspalathi]